MIMQPMMVMPERPLSIMAGTMSIFAVLVKRISRKRTSSFDAVDDLVMLDRFVEAIERRHRTRLDHGALVAVAGEGFDRLQRCPACYNQKLDAAAQRPLQQRCADEAVYGH